MFGCKQEFVMADLCHYSHQQEVDHEKIPEFYRLSVLVDEEKQTFYCYYYQYFYYYYPKDFDLSTIRDAKCLVIFFREYSCGMQQTS